MTAQRLAPSAQQALVERSADELIDEPATESVDESAVSTRWALVEAHRMRLLRLARRRTRCEQDAEDAVAEALVRAMEHVEVDRALLPAWLTTVTMRLCVDATRDQAREQRRWLRAGVSTASSSCEQRVCDAAEARWLADQVSVLPSRQELALRLRADGKDVGEVASELDVNYRTAESLLARGRARMRALLASTLSAVAVTLSIAWRWLLRFAHGGATAAVATGSAIGVAGVAVITTVAVPDNPTHSTPPPISVHADRPVARHIVEAPAASSAPAAQSSSTPSASTAPTSTTRAPSTGPASSATPPTTSGDRLPGIGLLPRLPLPRLPSPTGKPGQLGAMPPHATSRPAPPSPLLPLTPPSGSTPQPRQTPAR